MTSEAPVLLSFEKIGMTYKRGKEIRHVIENVSFDVYEQDLIAIVGASGCGKTTLLRIACGLQSPTKGRILLQNAPVDQPNHSISLVYQHYGQTLLPWKNAIENVLFGLVWKSPDHKQQSWEMAMDLLASIGMADAAQRFPWELSGGMQQRIALARAIFRRPKVLLLDEPFTALDETTRKALKDLLIKFHVDGCCAIVLVSHDLNEVAHLSKRVVLLGGKPTFVKDILKNKSCNGDELRLSVNCLLSN